MGWTMHCMQQCSRPPITPPAEVLDHFRRCEATRSVTLVVSEVRDQIGVESSLEDCFDNFLQKATFAGDLHVRGVDLGQCLVERRRTPSMLRSRYGSVPLGA